MCIDKQRVVEKSQLSVEEEFLSTFKDDNQFEIEVNSLKEEMKQMKEKEISQKLHRNTLFEAMDNIVDERKENFEKLKRSIVAMNQRAMPKCWYGISCYRRFCKLLRLKF